MISNQSQDEAWSRKLQSSRVQCKQTVSVEVSSQGFRQSWWSYFLGVIREGQSCRDVSYYCRFQFQPLGGTTLLVWTDEKYKGQSLFSFCHYSKYTGFFIITFTVVPYIIQEINCHRVTHRLWQPQRLVSTASTQPSALKKLKSHLTRQCECCKDDLQSIWEKANFDPQPTKNP